MLLNIAFAISTIESSRHRRVARLNLDGWRHARAPDRVKLIEHGRERRERVEAQRARTRGEREDEAWAAFARGWESD